MPLRFRDRVEAGQVLAEHLADYNGRSDLIVLALPRGGVPVGAEVARALGAPLDVFIVRKLGVPGHSELAMGAIASGGVLVRNDGLIQGLRIEETEIQQAREREQRELLWRERLYRNDRPFPDLHEKTVIVVDDGLATGASMLAAVRALRRLSPASIVVAVPVAAGETCRQLAQEADSVVCAVTPEPFEAVGRHYGDFSQTTDEEVQRLLAPGVATAPGRP
jgi:putative phosphoribosyl transferase